MADSRLTRRQLLKTASIAAATATMPTVSVASQKRRVLRIGHLTDIHVQPERSAAEGMQKCLEHVQGQKVDLIMTGGDLIMDALGTDRSRAETQWRIFNDVLRANSSVPVKHCIGNHDVWGWNNIEKYKSEVGFGKQMAQERLAMPKPYYSFDQAGWHFIVLDSTHRKKEGNGYTARLDDEQFEWLKGDLSSTPKSQPIIVLSHIPILSMTPFLDGDNEKSGDWQVPGAWMHVDARRIKDAFKSHPNVKLCASGHIHLCDKVEYLGVTYVCNGAVSGGWWGGSYQEFAPAYAVIDLYDDGSFENRMIEYGWTPKP